MRSILFITDGITAINGISLCSKNKKETLDLIRKARANVEIEFRRLTMSTSSSEESVAKVSTVPSDPAQAEEEAASDSEEQRYYFYLTTLKVYKESTYFLLF